MIGLEPGYDGLQADPVHRNQVAVGWLVDSTPWPAMDGLDADHGWLEANHVCIQVADKLYQEQWTMEYSLLACRLS